MPAGRQDSSEGKINCYNLLAEINKKELEFFLEKVNVPNQPFRTLVQYRNFSQLYLRLIMADEKLKSELDNYYDDKFWNNILSTPALRNCEQDLPATSDLQQHAVEIKIDALPAGDYLLLVSTDKNYNATKSLLGARLFYVSNISYINNGPNYFVLHRETGRPLVNAGVQIWEQRYDYKTSKNIKEKASNYKTDGRGYFKLERKKDPGSPNYTYLLDVGYNGERLFMEDYQYDYYYNNVAPAPQENISVFLFTDRSIYRPGQTLFVKGIVISRDLAERKNDIKTDYETMIYLRDANYQLVDSMKIKTNDYGSFSAKFQLPQTGLNGQFTLMMKDDRGSASFSVEEYKRPKFYVDYEKLKGTYKVNDKIKLTGFAKAYAGNVTDDATVKYRIVRQPRFIYPWLFWRWWQPPTSEMEIAHGEIKTGKDGKFEIEFTAIPDLAIDKKFEPVFDYHVYADVTDINGETRSGEKIISVSYKSLLLNVVVPDKLPADSLKNISISTTNLAGEFDPALLTVTIHRLRDEKRLIRKRYWQRPDQFVMSRDEYIKLFPFDEYNNENDFKTWEKESTAFERTDSTKGNEKFKMLQGSPLGQNAKLIAGLYLIEALALDKYGQEGKDVKYIELFDEKSNHLNHPEYLWTDGSSPIEPGEGTTIKLGTSAENVFVIQQIDKSTGSNNYPNQQAAGNYQLIKLNSEKKSFEFTATESERGGYGVNYFFVKNNRFYQYNDVIKVPWTNKELKIEYATFRDKTLPGSEEKWKLKITGYKNEKVAAEMLASMYDASLDQFKPHNLDEPAIWPLYSNYSFWNGNYNFVQVQSNLKRKEENPGKYLDKRYDVLLSNRFYGGEVFHFGNAAAPMIRIRGNKQIANEELKEVVVTAHGNQQKKDVTSALSGKVAGLLVTPDGRSIKDGDDFASDSVLEMRAKKQQGSEVQIRKNFNETAFFFPDLHTDSTGAIEFSFTMPEA